MDTKMDETNYVISKDSLEEFKKVYSGTKGGKYNLQVQVPYLKQLAEGYQKRYSETGDWTDCLKSHALWNSVSVRCPSEEQWSQKAYELQESFWQESASTSFKQQKETVNLLKNKIQQTRKTTRKNLKVVESFLHQFGQQQSRTPIIKGFCDATESAGVQCTDAMIKLTELVFQKSVETLRDPPPCEFCVVVIGSMAKGEATPYSDLEYLFLVERKDEFTEKWFEELAVTSYFLIGNLQETKLKYMNIAELRGWFDDQQQNGFKIDGLTEGAGNIPTGNGCSNRKNHFIVTPEELVQTYHEVLDHPISKEAVRGDLSAMLQYTKLVFSHEKVAGSLLLSFKSKKEMLEINAAREAANLEMFESDAKNYDFRPDGNLIDKCYTVDNKRELYRHPSILLFNISILAGFCKANSWETLRGLLDSKKISSTLYDSLLFLLSCACYFRLATYLHHDSQDDRVSVLPTVELLKDSTKSPTSGSARRWFLPQDLFDLYCEQAILVKNHIKKTPLEKLSEHLNKELPELTWLMKFYVYYCCNRCEVALDFLYKHVTETVVKDQPDKILELMSDEVDGNLQDLWKLVKSLSYCLCQSRKWDIALKYTSFLKTRIEVLLNEQVSKKQDWELLLANVLDEMGIGSKYLHQWENARKLFTESLDLRKKYLSSSSDTVAQSYGNIASLESLLMNLSEAKKFSTQGLQIAYENALQVVEYDYYGRPIEPQKARDKISSVHLAALPVKHQLVYINQYSLTAKYFLRALCRIFFLLKRYEEAACFGKKALEMLEYLYGAEACNQELASGLHDYARACDMIGRYQEADVNFHKAVIIYVRAHCEESEHSLEELVKARNKMDKERSANDYYQIAMKIFFNLPRFTSFHFQTAEALRHFAYHLVHQRQHTLADEILRKCKNGVEKVMRPDHKNRLAEEALAYIKAALALNCWKTGNSEEARMLYDEALNLREENILATQLDAAEILQQKSMMHLHLNELQDAENCLSRALEIYQRNCEEGHPKIKEAGEQLRNVRVHLSTSHEQEGPGSPKRLKLELK